jgi:hypothetical protein
MNKSGKIATPIIEEGWKGIRRETHHDCVLGWTTAGYHLSVKHSYRLQLTPFPASPDQERQKRRNMLKHPVLVEPDGACVSPATHMY